MSAATVRAALVRGGVTAGLCIPFIALSPLPRALRTAQVLFLFPLCVLLHQVSLAWGVRRAPLSLVPRTGWSGVALLQAALAASVAGAAFVDPLIPTHWPHYFPSSLQEVGLTLPWVCLFQTVALVAAVYAFASRLSRCPAVAVAAVVAARQGLLLLQLEGVETRQALGLLTAAGAYGLLAAWSYRRYGTVGPVVIAFFSEIRYAVPLL